MPFLALDDIGQVVHRGAESRVLMGAERHAGVAIRVFLATVKREDSPDLVHGGDKLGYAFIHPGSDLDRNLAVRHRHNLPFRVTITQRPVLLFLP